MIVGFLLLGITWSISVVVASQSDGGPAIVDDYYQKAISWDQEAKRRAQSDAYNWNIEIELSHESSTPLLTTTIRDANGNPVEGFQGSIRVMRPHKAQPVTMVPLNHSAKAAGTYTSYIPQLTRGLWDFQIDAHKDELLVYTTIRKEF